VLASLVGYDRRGERSMTIVAALILVVIALSVALARGLEG
jgi:predicted nucleic acid-binding Zn ribbon protein